MIFYQDKAITIHQGDCLDVLKIMDGESVQCIVTSPPYWGLRDYGHDGQIGMEDTPQEYVEKIVCVFRETKRVLRKDGTLWLNLGDTYCGGGRGSGYSEKQDSNRGTVNMPKSIVPNGLKPKDLVGIPWRVALALQADGWYLRQDIIWNKSACMPESVTDRCTKSHEYIFLLSKSANYYFDYEAIQEEATGYDGRKDTTYKGGNKDVSCGKHERWKKRKNDDTANSGNGTGIQDHSGYSNIENPYVRNKRSVWTVPIYNYHGAHFATYPPDLIKPCILAGCPAGGIVLDPFSGSGTTLAVSQDLGRKSIGIELNPEYCKLIIERAAQTNLFV